MQARSGSGRDARLRPARSRTRPGRCAPSRGGERVALARTTATGLVGVLAAVAEQEPVLLALDDVQWLNPASERALAFAFRRLAPQVNLLLARRSEPGAELPLGLARALPEERVARVALGPLPLAALHQVVSSRIGVSLSRPLLATLAEACGDNPLFALEIARALTLSAGGQDPGAPLPVPRSLEELAAARRRPVDRGEAGRARCGGALASDGPGSRGRVSGKRRLPGRARRGRGSGRTGPGTRASPLHPPAARLGDLRIRL
jgi:hypothetical protein